MNKTNLVQALKQDTPSPNFTIPQKALWLTHHNKWQKAHDLVQSGDDGLSSLIHGYLHHIEGDHWNGDYWYRQSGYDVPKEQDRQWEFIVEQVAQ